MLIFSNSHHHRPTSNCFPMARVNFTRGHCSTITPTVIIIIFIIILIIFQAEVNCLSSSSSPASPSKTCLERAISVAEKCRENVGKLWFLDEKKTSCCHILKFRKCLQDNESQHCQTPKGQQSWLYSPSWSDPECFPEYNVDSCETLISDFGVIAGIFIFLLVALPMLVIASRRCYKRWEIPSQNENIPPIEQNTCKLTGFDNGLESKGKESHEKIQEELFVVQLPFEEEKAHIDQQSG